MLRLTEIRERSSTGCIAAWLFAPFVLCGAVGCSDTTNIVQANCGEGTVLSGGTCVAADGSVAEDASADTTAAADALDGSLDALEEVSADASRDADASTSADPCPSTPPALDCAKDCGGPSSICEKVKCHPLSSTEAVTFAALPGVIRTPDRPGVDLSCPLEECPRAPIAYGMFFAIIAPGSATSVRVSVDPPWLIDHMYPFHTYCPSLASYDQRCLTFENTPPQRVVLVYTFDKNAPARNVRITADGACP